mmetsp:Transcript_5973/g.12955  ORF Transcript_5973/g.12955 Transcript_5973/m.12955 type:complete len:657 (+) Transcript_5973:174-2144(+)
MKPSSLFLLISLFSSNVDLVIGQGECSAANPCPNSSHCCSQYGYCGTSDTYCGTGCQAGPCGGGAGNYNYCGLSWFDASNTCGTSCYEGDDTPCSGSATCYADATACPIVNGPGGPPPTTTPVPTPPAPTPPTGGPPTGPTPVAGGDSRVIAYVGNWLQCPTADMIDGYTHIVIAFAVSYTYNAQKNNCNSQCDVGTSIPVCVGATASTVSSWRAQGKKVILSFGGAGMGGSWNGDSNNCWDNCFGKEDAVSTALVNMVNNMGLDGVDLDYEYCYDTTGNRHSGCNQVTSLYTDAKAQNFLTQMTSQLRTKLDNLALTTERDYELTHAPMDSDLVPDSPYYQILKDQNQNLNFLMPQFYNGITRPVADGFDQDIGQSGQMPTSEIYNNIANDIFPGQPNKVVLGFCANECINTATGPQAATVMQQVKEFNGGEFACNGGAFFWMASYDTAGAWSDPVYAEVSQTNGCSDVSGTVSPTKSPTVSPIPSPTKKPTDSPVMAFPGQCSDGTGVCSASDLSQCTCAARRTLLKGNEPAGRTGSNGKQKRNLRKLGKKTSPPSPPATPGPTPLPTTKSPSKQPTQLPTQSPIPFECSCLLPTPEPTARPTQPLTPAPTPNPTPPTNGCPCGDETQRNLCINACGGNSCRWVGSSKTCVLKV